jgi:hypothetical protein
MADGILIASIVIITVALFIRVLITARRAWDSRPVNIELIPSNNSTSAGEVNLGPYVDIICGQFPEVLDN